MDIIAAWPERLVPFEVKYRNEPVGPAQLRGLRQFCAERNVPQGHLITKNAEDFGLLPRRTPMPMADR